MNMCLYVSVLLYESVCVCECVCGLCVCMRGVCVCVCACVCGCVCVCVCVCVCGVVKSVSCYNFPSLYHSIVFFVCVYVCVCVCVCVCEIGRVSWRERVYLSAGAVSLKKNIST